MRFCVLNIPNDKKIIRKYSCSYYANGFLYPPIELLRVATIIKERVSINNEILFLDAIAENLNEKRCIKQIIEFAPDYLITLISVDFSNSEKSFIANLKKIFEVKVIAIGYLPDLYPQCFPVFDVILGSDFESRFFKVLDKEKNDDFLNKLKIATEPNVFNADIIKGCDYSFLNSKNYYEFLANGKTAFTYFSFGCPYKCSYCIRTYNLDSVFFRNTKSILDELSFFDSKGYSNVRIMDDNCTLSKSLLNEIKDYCEQNMLHFNFYGLTRIDLIDDEIVEILKKLNFKRIFIGIESFDIHRINEYRKGKYIDLKIVKDKINKLVKSGIEVGVFLLFNPLNEDWTSVKKSLKILKSLPIQHAGISYLVPYPGTSYYEDNYENIRMEFSPDYSIKYKVKNHSLNILTQYYFYIMFYLFNRKRVLKSFGHLLFYPKQIITIIVNLFFRFFKGKRERIDFS